jgi:hypothetical protein
MARPHDGELNRSESGCWHGWRAELRGDRGGFVQGNRPLDYGSIGDIFVRTNLGRDCRVSAGKMPPRRRYSECGDGDASGVS